MNGARGGGIARGGMDALPDLARERAKRYGVRDQLHEMRVRISHMAGHSREYREHLAHMERFYRPTGATALTARCEHIAVLQPLPLRERLASVG